MKIVVYGTGCKKCKALHDSVKKIVEQANIAAEVVYQSDLNVIILKNMMQLPVLEVDGVIKSKGRLPKEKELKEILRV